MIPADIVSVCRIIKIIGAAEEGGYATSSTIILITGEARRKTERIRQDMVRKGYLSSFKGPNGGYRLTPKAEIVDLLTIYIDFGGDRRLLPILHHWGTIDPSVLTEIIDCPEMPNDGDHQEV